MQTPEEHYLPLQTSTQTHPLAVAIRVKAIKLRNSTSITFHWVKGHAGLKGNERSDYLAKTVARYKISSLSMKSLSVEESKYWKTTTQKSGTQYL